MPTEKINDSRNWPNPDFDLSSRDYFQALKANPENKILHKPAHDRARQQNLGHRAGPSAVDERGRQVSRRCIRLDGLEILRGVFHSIWLGQRICGDVHAKRRHFAVPYPPAGEISTITPASVLTTWPILDQGYPRSVSPVDREGPHRRGLPAAELSAGRGRNALNEDNAFAAWRARPPRSSYLPEPPGSASSCWLHSPWRHGGGNKTGYIKARNGAISPIESDALGTWYIDLRKDELWWSGPVSEKCSASRPRSSPAARYFPKLSIHPTAPRPPTYGNEAWRGCGIMKSNIGLSVPTTTRHAG